MKLDNFIKSPVERKRYTIDYSDWLDTGETISSVTFAVTPTTTNTLEVDAYVLGTGNTSVIFFANYGDANNIYTVDVQIVTSGGQTKEDTILFTVRSAT
jgi:hypothetical protein